MSDSSSGASLFVIQYFVIRHPINSLFMLNQTLLFYWLNKCFASCLAFLGLEFSAQKLVSQNLHDWNASLKNFLLHPILMHLKLMHNTFLLLSDSISISIYLSIYMNIYIYIYIYIYRKQSSAFKRLLETLLLTIKMCTGFTTDALWVNRKVYQCH